MDAHFDAMSAVYAAYAADKPEFQFEFIYKSNVNPGKFLSQFRNTK
jgi:hypothetical protein